MTRGAQRTHGLRALSDRWVAGITREILADRERIVFEWSKARGTPVTFVLAGGYIERRLDATELVEIHRLTLSAAVSEWTTNRSPEA